MTHNRRMNDDFDIYEDMFDDRKDRRARKQQGGSNHRPKKSDHEIRAQLSAADASDGFKTTYQPSRYEEGWLMQALRDFYRMDYITDVLAQVRGGKEASVYRCSARPGMDADLLAAKVYRPRQFRQLRNDQMYREGRQVLTAEGKAAKETDHRLMRALGKKTEFGAQVAHTSWLMYEYQTLQRLYSIGAAVPKPYAASTNAILMGYVGDANRAGSTLSEVSLDVDEANTLLDEVLRNIELMLANGMIHGDLNSYNILYWEGKITLIDFPQVTDSHGNSQAYSILKRDIERVCTYFAGQGADRDPSTIMRRLWKTYVERDAKQVAADMSRFEPQES